jgi:competence protein ComEA
MPDPEVPDLPATVPEHPSLLERLPELRRDPRVVAVVVAVVVVAAAFAWLRSSAAPRAPSAVAAPASVPDAGEPTTTTTARALVHVVGAVRTPGVVELASSARVRDALAAAGGPAEDADLERLNLAAPVTDGQRIAVPRVGEPGPVAIADPATPDGATSPAGPLDLNAATLADLEALPGIGPTLAEAILRERERRGRFESVEDLKQVRGIGEQRFADIRDLVTV